MLQIANRKSQTINNTQSIIDWRCEASTKETRTIASLRIILIMIFISINSYAQGNLSVTLVPKTYVGNYHLSCNGANNGEIEAVISGGTAPYSVLWNTNSTANPILNLPAGAYSVTIIDAANDTVQANYTLVQPPALSFNLEVPHFGEYNVQYAGSTFGSIKINGTGGTPSYSVLWSDNNTELIRDSLSAGNYTFVLSDANGCTTNGNKTLTQPAALAGSLNQIHGTSCFEGDDGKAEASVTGGIPPYHYLWDNGSFSAAPEDLTPGLHEVHISDDKNNTLTLQVTITQATAIEAQISKSNYPNNFNVSCYNCFNGTLDALASGGTGPYTYEWIWKENSIGSTPNLANFGGGEYELIINDNNNCKYRNKTSLKEPERQDWGMSGNAGTNPSNEFIGTTDSVDVVFKSNNHESMRLSGEKVRIPGNLLLGPSAHISSGETNGNFWFHVGATLPGGPQGILQDVCFPTNLSTGKNIFDGMLQTINPYSATNISGASLMMGSAGTNGSIEVVSYGINNTLPAVTSTPPILKINTNCGNDTYVGNSNAGNLIVEHALGVNTTTPQTPLHVEGTTYLNGNVGIAVSAPEAGLHNAGMSIFENKVGIGQSFTALNAESSILQVNGKAVFKEIFVEDANATNSFLLRVNGKIRCRGIRMDNDVWADFVFTENYALMPIPELEKFILKNKHHPNFLSVENYKKEGIELQALLVAQQQTIEELILYVIELNKKINALKK